MAFSAVSLSSGGSCDATCSRAVITSHQIVNRVSCYNHCSCVGSALYLQRHRHRTVTHKCCSHMLTWQQRCRKQSALPSPRAGCCARRMRSSPACSWPPPCGAPPHPPPAETASIIMLPSIWTTGCSTSESNEPSARHSVIALHTCLQRQSNSVMSNSCHMHPRTLVNPKSHTL